MSDLTNIARPYAKAAFDFAVEQNALSAWLQMLTFAAEIANNNQVSAFLNANGTAKKQADLFIHVCGEQLNEHGHNFIKVMAENHRLLALPEVLTTFAKLKAEYEKEIDVTVVSATELDNKEKEKLAVALTQRLARKVKLNCSVDPSLVDSCSD